MPELTEQVELAEATKKRWDPIVNHPGMEKINCAHRRFVTASLLENTQNVLGQEGEGQQVAVSITEKDGVITEAAPTNNIGGGNIATWDPILIPLIRRTAPKLIAFDTIGVQPMSGPTGLIFAMRSRYTNQTGTEAMFNEPETAHSGRQDGSGNKLDTGTTVDAHDGSTLSGDVQTPTDATNNPFEGTWVHGDAATTAEMEQFGDGGSRDFAEMAFSIEKKTVTARSRALKAEYTTELSQDLRAIHGLDAETELSNILSTEIVAEINREIVRTLYKAAKLGAQKNTASAGTFNLDTDANGRWSVEKFKGLMVALERDANQIAKETRRGRGNWIICSSDVATALNMAGKLESNPLGNALSTDDTGDTFVGVLNGKYRVYIDPYWDINDMEIYVVGYKGASPWDAGMYYAPYVPLQMVRAIGENSFQPKIGFKTRYGLTTNPFTSANFGSNVYYRKTAVVNIM